MSDKEWLRLGKQTPNMKTWESWNKIHQPFELDWWQKQLADGTHYADDKMFNSVWTQVSAFINPKWPVIDIGCGPRPPFSPCAVIEPLADEYRKFTPEKWWEGVDVFSRPAEEHISGLKADTVICWNCIDHTIDWCKILDNMLAYGNPGARFAISTDFHKPFIGHPGFGRLEFMAEIDKRFRTIDKVKPSPCGRDLALLLEAKE